MTGNRKATNRITRLIRDPLVGFALASGLLFWAYGFLAGDGRPEITVARAFVETMVADRELVLGRSLTDREVETIIQGFIDQEVLVREAMARRLYLNDGQVRHRLADKMFYLLADDVGEPTEQDLDDFYEANRGQYRTPELVSFQHRYFGDDEARASAAFEDDGGADPGVDFYVGGELTKYAAAELVPIFGYEFTRALGDLEPGVRYKPMQSSRGWHLVTVTERIPEQEIPRAEIEERIRLDWREAALAESRRQQLDMLRQNYRVIRPSRNTDAPGS